jgi:hypothetical protein
LHEAHIDYIFKGTAQVAFLGRNLLAIFIEVEPNLLPKLASNGADRWWLKQAEK